ncbi:hypothetical protein KOW79_017333 [Hemibagrus wyckioides]|uniref:Uncharacterized protein n=1 Tax=Hemibagrus wyckioides TaxID=337641 RepID=A0A9D3SH65_9TELE|nr:hypothetical protein KOW79_017333 [Hemibagrus wyckioides]
MPSTSSDVIPELLDLECDLETPADRFPDPGLNINQEGMAKSSDYLCDSPTSQIDLESREVTGLIGTSSLHAALLREPFFFLQTVVKRRESPSQDPCVNWE